MAWRWLTGAPMSRQWIDFSAISPALPPSVVAAEDAHFCNHHGVDWGAVARGDRRCPGRRRSSRRLDHHPAGGEEPVPVAAARPGPQGSGVSARDVDRSGCCRSSGFWRSTSTLPNSGRPASSARKQALPMPSATRHPACRRAKRHCWRQSCPIRSGAAPAIQVPGCAGWPGPIWPGHRLPESSAAGTKIAHFEPILSYFEPSFAHSILYKRGLIGISARVQNAEPSALGRCPRQNP